jgi:hypothetical protein
MTMTVRPSQIIAAVWDLGSDASDLRDAAHEAHHALRCKLTQPWTREAVHEALVGLCRGDGVLLLGEELDARAVEWTVCEAVGVSYDLEHWAFIAAMESLRVGVAHPLDMWKRGIVIRHGTKAIERAARAVVKLARPDRVER